VHDILGLNVSHDTLNHVLWETGFKPGRKAKKPSLMAKQKKERLLFIQAHKDWMEADWKHVIFSDETVIRHFGSN